MRRLLITLIIVIVLLGTALAVYILFFSPSGAHLTVTTGSFNNATSGTAAPNPTATPDMSSGAGTVVAPNFVEITSSPVAAGVGIFDVSPTTATSASSTATNTPPVAAQAGNTMVEYVDRQSGNVYQYGAQNRSLTRISDKTLPGIQEASWTADGSLAFVQFLADASGAEELDTYALPSNGQGGYFLQPNLDEAVVNGSNSVFTLADNGSGSVGSTAHTDGTSVQTVFNSPLTSIIVHPAGTGFIAVTKAASELDGYAFSIGTSGNFSPILGPLRGLTVLPSPSGQELLYSYTDGSSFHMSVLDLTTGSTTNLPVATLAEKCVWTSDSSALYCAVPTSFAGNLPDDWYQGVQSFNDRIWRIDLASHLATLVIDPSQANVSIDAVNLAIDPNNTVLIFRNKKDSSLWAYTLTQ